MSRPRSRRQTGLLWLLALLALLELRPELQLLWDHFTWTSLTAIPVHHPLPVALLISLPLLRNRNG